MPLYGTAQAGSNATAGLNLTSVIPGDSYTLFDGTETPGAAVKSVAFSRGYSPSADDAGTTFFIQFASAPTAVVQIQCAYADVEADYQTVYTSTSTQQDSYTDIGRAPFYRAVLSTYSAGGMPVVTAVR